MNLEKFIDHELHKGTIDVEITNEDGSVLTDPNYENYEVINVRYVQTAYITVKKK